MLSFHLLESAKSKEYLIPALVCQVSRVYILRTLDPEDSHQVSLARVFQAAGLTIIDGLLRFRMLKDIDYHVKLGYAGPNLVEVWTSVGRARSIVADLWPEPPTAIIDLLAPSIDRYFTLYDRTRSSLLHNWTLSTISPAAYSTTLLLQATFSVKEMQWLAEKSAWVRTGMPKPGRPLGVQDTFDTAMIQWSIDAAEQQLIGEGQQLETNVWRPVLSHIEHLLALPSVADPASKSSDGMETALVAMCERLARHANGNLRLEPVSDRATPVKRMVDCSTQTEAESRPVRRNQASQTTEEARYYYKTAWTLCIVVLGSILAFIMKR